MLGVGPATLLGAGLFLWAGVGRLRQNVSEEVLETIQPAIDEAVKRQDDRIEKRAQRTKPDKQGAAEDWERQVKGIEAGKQYD